MGTSSQPTHYVTSNDLDEFGQKLSKQIIDDLSGVIQQFAFQVDQRFNDIELRLDKIEANLDRLTNTIEAFVKRLDDMEIDNTARDAQHQRLLAWAEKVSAKTGIPLEY